MKALIMAGWDDVPHIDEETKTELLSSFPEHERKARREGKPVLGSGAVFPFDESYVRIDPFPIPDHWYRISGVDFGWDHPAAGAWLAIDRDTDTAYLYDCYSKRQTKALDHAAIIKARGEWIPCAWPRDGYQHDKGSGLPLAEQYADEGVNMLPEYAHIELPPKPGAAPGTPMQKSVSLEASIADMVKGFNAQQLRVFSHLEDFWREYRTYHRKDGQIVPLIDDVISAARYAYMMRRHAKQPPRERERVTRTRNWMTA